MGVRGRKAERGAAAVEFALLLPVLVVILLGTIDWGYFFFAEQVVTNAAREGARAGSVFVGGNTQAATTTAQTYLTNGGLTGVAAINSSMSGPNQITVTVSYPTGSITGFTVLSKIMPARAQATAVMSTN